MKSVEDWLNEYAESHQNPINVMIHWLCVPLIMLSIIGLLATFQFNIMIFSSFSQFHHVGSLLIIFGCIYYLFLSKNIFDPEH